MPLLTPGSRYARSAAAPGSGRCSSGSAVMRTTLTVIRPQARLSAELRLSTRQIRTHLKKWRDRGVLRVLEHGGGKARKPAKYQIDLFALSMFILKCSDQATAEARNIRNSSSLMPPGSLCDSRVDCVTAEALGLPQSESAEQTSGVEAKQGKSEGEISADSGSACTSYSSESYSKRRSEEASSQDMNTRIGRSLPRAAGSARSRALSLDEEDPDVKRKRRLAWELIEGLTKETS